MLSRKFDERHNEINLKFQNFFHKMMIKFTSFMILYYSLVMSFQNVEEVLRSFQHCTIINEFTGKLRIHTFIMDKSDFL